jgi:endoglucanase
MTELRWPSNVRPAVRINQVGYHPDATKRAVLVTDAGVPQQFEVRNHDERVVLAGSTQPWPVNPEPSSGMAVHIVDFTAVRATGDGYVIVTGSQSSHRFVIAADLYRGVCVDALRFFYRQRSGIRILDPVDPRYDRAAGHLGIPPNRGDTAVRAWSGADAERWYPGWRCDGVFDVSGGWYDAGDHGKYVVNAALAVSQLLSVWERTGDATSSSIWPAIGEALVEECRWELDWLMRMQVPSGFPLAGMAFHRVHGTEWEPEAIWPHLDPTERVLHRPSTAATLNLAAACAHAARLYRRDDPAYARQLLTAARTAHRAAHDHPLLYAPDDHGAHGGGPYDDDQIDDEFYWAASELYLTTGEPDYHAELHRSSCHHEDVFEPDGYDWQTVATHARLQLAANDGPIDDRNRIRDWVVDAADRLGAIQDHQPWGQPYAPADGWDWGSNGRILANLIVIATAHDLTRNPDHLDRVRGGIDYLFGRNAHGQCYVTGHGTDHTHHQRTRHYAHDHDSAFPPPPPGAVAGGPNSKNYPGFPGDARLAGLADQLHYIDEHTSETTNDICINWNAPLVWTTAYLADRE